MCRGDAGAELAAAEAGVSAVRSRVCSLATGRSFKTEPAAPGFGFVSIFKVVSTTYQALYRKYRPMTFDDVWGQEHITDALKAQVNGGRLSHAYLFVGTRGTGKTTCAKLLARAANCEHPVNGSPCNECAACRGILDGTVMDVVEIDAASNNGVDNIRALRDEAVFSPATVKKRVYIVDEVHMLSTSAFNALLKILEEPPEHLMFILATTELRKVPATIVSRCQRYNFRRLDAGVIARRLQYVAESESLRLTEGAARLLARLAEGGMRDALSLLDQCAGRGDIDERAVLDATGAAGEARTAELLEAVAAHDVSRTLELFSAMWDDGKDPAGVLSDLSALIRDTLLLSVAPKGAERLISGAYDRERLRRFAAAFTGEELLRALSAAQGGVSALRDNPSPRTAAELTLISLCSPQLSADAAALSARLSRVEAGLASLKAAGLPSPSQPAPAERVEDVPRAEVSTPEPGDDVPWAEEATPEPGDDVPRVDEATPEPGDDVPWIEEATPERGEEVPRADAATPEPGDDIPRVDEATPEREAPGAAADGGAGQWRAFLAAAEKLLPKGVYLTVANPDLVRGEAGGGRVTLRAEPGYSFNLLNSPVHLKALQDAARSALGGAALELLPSEEGEDAIKRRMDELRRFDIVKFT